MEWNDYIRPSLLKRQKRRDKRLDKELIECYRRNARIKEKRGYKNKLAREGFRHARQKEGIRMMYKNRKFFTDNLEPLQRYLESKIGKNWDKVHSELCSRLKKNTVSGLHVFNHLYDFIILNTIERDKKVYHIKFGKLQELYSTERWPKYFIQSKTGQLRKARLVSNAEARTLW